MSPRPLRTPRSIQPGPRSVRSSEKAEDDEVNELSDIPHDLILSDQSLFSENDVEIDEEPGGRNSDSPTGLGAADHDEPASSAARSETTSRIAAHVAEPTPASRPPKERSQDTSAQSQSPVTPAPDSSAATDPAGAYLGLLSIEERAAIAERAYRRGPGIADPDWIIAYAVQRAVDQIGSEMNTAVQRVRTLLAEPREYIVHADGAGGRPEDVVAIRRQLEGIAEKIETLPYRSTSSVARMTEPFTQLAEASATLITAIDKTRISATAAIADTAKEARQQMLRTAFEGHALSAKKATVFHLIEIGLIAILIAVAFATAFHANISRALV
jgi:hypothetical protein